MMFAKLSEFAQSIFFILIKDQPFLPLLITPLVGGTAVWLTHRYFEGAQGSGIPQVIAATKLAKEQKDVSHLISLKLVFGKILVVAYSLMGGFSIGREGPSVQVAASILQYFHRWLPNPRIVRASDLILAGGAAGIAAAFNTPLAGIIFAIEELGKRLESRTSAILISAIVFSGLVSIALMGNYQYFGRLAINHIDMRFIFYIPLAAVVCGILGGAFSRILLMPVMYPDFFVWKLRKNYPVRFAVFCGLFVAVIGVSTGGITYGNGYGLTGHIINGGFDNSVEIFFTKYLATLASYFSGIPGGIFAPSLAIGSSLGGFLYEVVGQGGGYLIPLMALCMAGFLAAVTQAPITSAIIVMEMIDGHEMLISLLAVAFIAKVISGRISPELYQRLSLGFLK